MKGTLIHNIFAFDDSDIAPMDAGSLKRLEV